MAGVENVRLFPGVGTCLSLVYVICLAYSELLVTVAPGLDEITFTWFTLLCFTVFFPAFLYFRGLNPWVCSVRDRWLLAFTGITEVLSNVFVCIAVAKAPLGDVTTIWNTTIILVPICEAAITVLKREECPLKCIPLQILFMVMAFSGVILITQPSFLFPTGETKTRDAFTYFIGYASAFGNTVVASANYIIVGQLDHIHWAIVSASFIPASALVLPIMTYFLNGFRFQSSAKPLDYFAAFISGFLDIFSNAYCTLAQKVASASTVTLISTLEIPLGYLLDFVFNGIKPCKITIGGACLVMAAVVGATLVTLLEERKGLQTGKNSIQDYSERSPLLPLTK